MFFQVNNCNIGVLFNHILNHLNMKISLPPLNHKKKTCFITKEKYKWYRIITFNYCFDTTCDHMANHSFVVRSDLVDMLRWFYIYAHFCYYLFKKCVHWWKTEYRSSLPQLDVLQLQFMQDMYQVYRFCESQLELLTTARGFA